MARTKRNYSDATKAETLAVLDANGGNVSHTARITGVPASTITEWMRGRLPDGFAEIRAEKKEALTDAIERVAYKLLGKIEESADGRVAMKDAATAFGICVDKMQLLNGKPTVIQQDRQVKADDLPDDDLAYIAGGSRNGAAAKA